MSGAIITYLINLFRKYPFESMGVIAVVFVIIPMLLVMVFISIFMIPGSMLGEDKGAIDQLAHYYQVEPGQAHLYMDLKTKNEPPTELSEIAYLIDDFIESVDIEIKYTKEVTTYKTKEVINDQGEKVKIRVPKTETEDKTYMRQLKKFWVNRVTEHHLRNGREKNFGLQCKTYLGDNIKDYINNYETIKSITVEVQYKTLEMLIDESYIKYSLFMSREEYMGMVEMKMAFIGGLVHEGELATFPAEGRITSLYGYRLDPFTGERDFHNGVDIAGPVGTPIKAVMDGKVIHASYDDLNGNMVKIQHTGGMITLYLHNSQLNVLLDQEVKKGDIISYMGNTGRSTGSHLHFSLKTDNEFSNPQSFVQLYSEEEK